MPRQTGAGNFSSKLGGAGRKAFDAHKTDDTSYGAGADLPAGIEGGIAQLVDCKFDQYKRGPNQGEYYFYAAGVVVAPADHAGVSIEGLRTSIMEPLCDTPTRSRPDVDSHLDWVLNELRKLGVVTDDIDFDDLESVAASVKEEQPYFRFRTWQGEPTEQWPNPRVNHQWRGACDYTPDDDDTGVVDDTEDEEAPAATGKAKAKAKTNNLPELGEAADEGDESAQTTLAELAEEAGIDSDEVNNADSWAAVTLLIGEPGDDGDDDDDDDDDE